MSCPHTETTAVLAAFGRLAALAEALLAHLNFLKPLQLRRPPGAQDILAEHQVRSIYIYIYDMNVCRNSETAMFILI